MVTTEKQEYQIFYNPHKKTFSGDTIIRFTRSGISEGHNIYVVFINKEFPNIVLDANALSFDIAQYADVDNNPNFPTEDKVFEVFFDRGQSMRRNFVGKFVIRLKIQNTEPLLISKDKISLRIDKNSNDIAQDTINFINSRGGLLSIEHPPSLTIEYNPTDINGSMVIKTNNNTKINEGIFEETITISNGVESKQVLVNIEVFKFAEWVFFPEDSYFCLDKRSIRIEKYKNEGKYARITLDFRVRNIPYTASYVVPYFQNEVHFDMGEKIHQYAMAQIEKDIIFNPGNEIYLSPIITNVKIEELDKDYQALYSSNLNGIKFYPGKTPKLYPIFSNHNIRRRVEDSKVLVGFENTEISFDELPKIDKRNQRQGQSGVMIQELTADNSLFAKVHNIRDLKIITMPKTGETIHIKWLNQNGVMEWATFSGEWKIETAAKNTIRKSIFSNQNKKFDASLEEILKLNTGFIFLAEVKMIREMMLSPLCEITIGERKIICIPNTEKITSEDSTRQLIAFDLDFLITFERL